MNPVGYNCGKIQAQNEEVCTMQEHVENTDAQSLLRKNSCCLTQRIWQRIRVSFNTDLKVLLR